MATAIKLKKPSAEKAWELIDQYADIFDAASLIPIPGAGSIFQLILHGQNHCHECFLAEAVQFFW